MENKYLNRCEEVLAHHGVKGMHWGIRRYQNPDGSLTAAGEKRYGGKKGDKRFRNDHIEVALEARKQANINTRVLEKSNKELAKSQKRYENSVIKNPDSKKTKRLKTDRDIKRTLNKAAEKASKTSIEKAKKYTDDLVRQYGDKSIKEIKYDKHGRIKDPTDTLRKALEPVAWLAAAGMAYVSPVGVGVVYTQATNKEIANRRYNMMYYSEAKRLKELEKEKYRK